MAQIIIDTNTIWKALVVIAFIILAAIAGYFAGKSSQGTYQNPNPTITVTVAQNSAGVQPFCSKLIFNNDDFQSPDVRYFNDGDVIPAGTYTLDVTGWYSPWAVDQGWLEEGATDAFKSAIYNDMAMLEIKENTIPTIIPLSQIVKGTFDREKSSGSAPVTLSKPSQIGVYIFDTSYPGNRGYAVFKLKNSEKVSC